MNRLAVQTTARKHQFFLVNVLPKRVTIFYVSPDELGERIELSTIIERGPLTGQINEEFTSGWLPDNKRFITLAELRTLLGDYQGEDYKFYKLLENLTDEIEETPYNPEEAA